MQTLVFLLDVDNTLLDNDAIKADWDEQLRGELGHTLTARFWEMYERVRRERGVVDIPLALSRLRELTPSMDEQTYQHIRSLFFNYPFYKRLYPYAIETLEHLRAMGKTVIVSDGDLVFQVEKITKSHLAEAVEGRVLIFTHKQEHLDEITRAYPADHYVMVDDNAYILRDAKQIMRDRLTTVFVVQGHYATGQPPEGFSPDLSVPHIGDLRNYRREQMLAAERLFGNFR
ncbi:MAG: HAD family hydrolase [Ktedonobacteraceae bacterium]